MKLTIAINAYDSFDNVVEVLGKLHAQIADPNEVEVRVRNDNPDLDATRLEEACSEYGFHYAKNEQNIGESMSRQRNLTDAEGEYLAWIDADDQITDDYVSTILSEIETCHADIIMHRWHFKDGREGDQHPKPLANWNVWANVYKTDVVRDIKFDPLQVYSSDYYWLEKAVKEKNPTIYYSDKSVNIYNDGNYNSLTHRFQRGEIKARLDE
jgi:glycosyltransferase involved in cell wall biosynthesis